MMNVTVKADIDSYRSIGFLHLFQKFLERKVHKRLPRLVRLNVAFPFLIYYGTKVLFDRSQH